MANGEFTIELVRQADYRFEIHFDHASVPSLITDESPPLGADAGPNPERLLAAAVANCLSDSLLFALKKFSNDPGTLRTVATTQLIRNAQNHLRVGHIAVELHLGAVASSMRMLDRVLSQFEDFCVVTQSVRATIPVTVLVIDSLGVIVKPSSGEEAAIDDSMASSGGQTRPR